jgi:hypothetical protein
MPDKQQRPVKALEELDRDGVVVAKGAIFTPRDQAERDALGARVRDASIMECQIAGLPHALQAPPAPEQEPALQTEQES